MTLKNLTIVGYSGHSYLCIEAFVSLDLEILGYYDIVEKLVNPYKLQFLGNEEQIKIDHQPFISIGNNSIREKVYNKLLLNKICLDRSISHPSAIISNTSLIEKQTFVSAGVVINPQVQISKGCIINTGALIEHESRIGSFTHIGPGAVLAGNVSVGDRSMIGANAVIKQGVKIGNNVMIGAGAVIIRDVPNNVTIVGNPGRIIR
tara:strand:- start:512 stop:1126 length:615 start_codon:yes stop_codon:yes gene_type:complete